MKKQNYLNRKKWDFLIYIHDYLVLAGVFPFMACVCVTDTETFWRITWCSLFLILPILGSYLFLERVKFLLAYVILGFVTGALCLMLGKQFGGDQQGRWLVPILLLIACFALFMSGIGAKNAYGDAKREYLATHPGLGLEAFYLTEWDMETLFNNPRMFHWFFMGALYIVGVLLRYRSFLRIQFLLIVADILLVSAYRYILGMRNYLYNNRQLKNIPLTAMRRTHAVTGLVVGFLLVVCILPAILYGKEFIPTYADPPEYEYIPPEYEFQQANQNQEEDLAEWMEELGEYKEPPKWLNPLFFIIAYTIMAILGATIILAIVRKIKETGRNFQEEDQDQVEQLEEEKEDNENIISALKATNRREIKGRKIRKKYKKTIKRATLGDPTPWGTPTELELAAGLSEDDEMRKLHEAYEIARYGKEGIREE